MNDFTLIIFGITGDLCKRKIIPSLYNLLNNKKLNKISIIGAALKEKKIDEIYNSSKEFIENFDQATFDTLISISSYCQLDAKKNNDFNKLKDLIIKKENENNLSGNRLFYCAVGSNIYIDITKNLSENGIIFKNSHLANLWNRIVYEKPFAHNLKSAKKLNKELHKYLDETQIYRIDHYLAKEIVDNITFVRFTNRIFEPLWNNKNIDSIQIILDEKIGLEGRGKYYDEFGALKDVLQNHMLQLVSLVAMDTPKEISPNFIRESKAQVLKKTIPINGLRGQYKEYREEIGVKENSDTETFAIVKLLIKNKRWKNIPFYLKTGKFLDKKSTKIVVKFKKVDCLLPSDCPIDPNYLTISIYPDEGIIIEINTKEPYKKQKITKAKMEFCYSCLFEPESYQSYESILLDIVNGDRSISVRQDEIEYSWAIVDKIISMKLPLYTYNKYSKGPIQTEEFALNENFIWK